MLKLSFIKSGCLGILLLITCLAVQGQVNPKPKPDVCANTSAPPPGYKYGGLFYTSPTTGCVPHGGTVQNISVVNRKDNATNIELTSPRFYIDAPKNFDFSTTTISPDYPTITAPITILQKNFAPGWYWIIEEGTFNSQKYYNCQEIEVLRSVPPVTVANTCGVNSLTVTIPVDANNQYDNYTIEWGDNFIENISINATTKLPITKTHTYAGTHNIPNIKAGYLRNSTPNFCPSSPTNIIVPSSTPVFLTELNGENGGTEATLKFVDFAAGASYDIMGSIDDGNASGQFTKMAVAQNGTATITGLSPQNKYCFKASFKDACSNNIDSQNTICSIKLEATLPSSTQADLKWNLPTLPSGVPTLLRLYKNIVNCATCQSQPSLGSLTATTYKDTPLLCSKEYLYYIESTYRAIYNLTLRTIIVRSAQIKVDPKSNNTPIVPNRLVAVGYDPNDEDIIKINVETVSSNPVAKYQFFRAEAGSNDFVSVGSSVQNTFDDISISNKEVGYCYKYKQEDECGTTSDFSPPFCTVLLKSNQPGSLAWNPFELPKQVYNNLIKTEYTVELFDPQYGPNGQFNGQYTTLANFHSVQNEINNATTEEIRFRIKAIQIIDTDLYNSQPVISYSNIYTFVVPPFVFAPNAFTPNGLGPAESETFKVYTKFVSDATLTVYDAWGGIVFESKDLTEEWKGKMLNGVTEAPPGNYAYKIRGKSTAGKNFSFTGSILLLR